MSPHASFPLPNSAKPAQGPRGVPLDLVFAGAGVIEGDLQLEYSSGALEFVQSVYINNGAIATAFVLEIIGMGFIINVRANQQGVFPVIMGAGALRFRATAAGAGTVHLIFTNTEIQPSTWGV